MTALLADDERASSQVGLNCWTTREHAEAAQLLTAGRPEQPVHVNVRLDVYRQCCGASSILLTPETGPRFLGQEGKLALARVLSSGDDRCR
jgi:hypothetical protein